MEGKEELASIAVPTKRCHLQNVPLEELIRASLVLSAVGDALGYKGGSWEVLQQDFNP